MHVITTWTYFKIYLCCRYTCRDSALSGLGWSIIYFESFPSDIIVELGLRRISQSFRQFFSNGEWFFLQGLIDLFIILRASVMQLWVTSIYASVSCICIWKCLKSRNSLLSIWHLSECLDYCGPSLHWGNRACGWCFKSRI